MNDRIFNIVSECLKSQGAALGSEELKSPSPSTRLYGAKSALDSIALVTLIADIEEKIAEEFGKDIVLADERAMSRTRSPFGRVETLVDYIEEILRES